MRDHKSLLSPNGSGCRLLHVCAILICSYTHALADDNPISEDWEFEATPYVWFLSLDGDITVRGQKTSFDVNFDDLVQKTNSAAILNGEVRKGRFGGFVDTVYAELSDDAGSGPIRLDLSAENLWLTFGAFYRLGPWDLDPAAHGDALTVTVDPYIGGRYTYLETQLDLKPGPNFSGDQAWIDPIIGLRTIWGLSERWSVTLSGDVGGFSVGSDFAWQAVGLVGYGFGLFGDDDAHVMAGYRALYQDYSNGSGANKFEWDVTVHGPILGLSVQF
jgi:hypothetical protein